MLTDEDDTSEQQLAFLTTAMQSKALQILQRPAQSYDVAVDVADNPASTPAKVAFSPFEQASAADDSHPFRFGKLL